jgi:hypothetical protein
LATNNNYMDANGFEPKNKSTNEWERLIMFLQLLEGKVNIPICWIKIEWVPDSIVAIENQTMMAFKDEKWVAKRLETQNFFGPHPNKGW